MLRTIAQSSGYPVEEMIGRQEILDNLACLLAALSRSSGDPMIGYQLSRAIGRSLELAPGVIHRARLFRFHSFSSAYGLCRPRLVAIAQGIVREGNEKRSGQGDGPCSRCSVPSMFMNPPSIMLGTPEQNGAFHTGG
ncbi:hypothetical protein DTO027B6_5339 [Paecilomyces variotii]|nr:hypothetical protein DTO032I3_2558 [Paecilomyces variotii]KAJ9342093.1 hypothetical protein DTO027B6_5339 [Paecilomyces variotii]KAJ9358067.1 hypothetical protein DTO027B9_2637 [Paecilomyces variotii]KAJ9408342.1 hypothetical protein DTO045G8_3913 [Paecilomyces variotii]